MELLLSGPFGIFWHLDEEEQPAEGSGIRPPPSDSETFNRSAHFSS
jgi:hypothetical protein